MLNNGSGTGGDRPRELPHAEVLWANGLTFRRYENATVSGGQIVGSLYVAERTVQYFSRNSSRARFDGVGTTRSPTTATATYCTHCLPSRVRSVRVTGCGA